MTPLRRARLAAQALRGEPWGAPALVFVLALAFRLGYLAVAGPGHAVDTISYLSTCRGWATDPWTQAHAFVGIETSSYTLPMCAVLGLGVPQGGWLLVQIVVASAACALLFSAVREGFGARPAWVAGLGLAFLWESVQWDLHILTESFFVAYLCLTLWAFARWHARPTRARAAALFMALVLTALARPIGPFVALAWVGLYAVMQYRQLRAWNPPVAAMARVLPVMLGALLLFSAWNEVAFRSQAGDAIVQTHWATGIVIDDDPTFDHRFEARPAVGMIGFLLANPLDTLILFALRGAVLFLPFSARFSAAHLAVNAVSLLPLLVLGFAGLALAIRRGRPEALPWLVPVAVPTAMVMLTFVDYDWRYRLPTLVPLLAFAGVAVDRWGVPWAIAERALAILGRTLGSASTDPGVLKEEPP